MTHTDFRPAPSLVRVLAGAPIRVGTQNPSKLEAVRSALAIFQTTDAILDLVPVDVASGVPDQPIGHAQILSGARNRARAAFESGDAMLAVGIEDGLIRFSEPAEESGREHEFSYNIGCAWLTDGEREGHGFSAGFSYPRACSEPALRDRLPIGDLFDEMWRSRRGLGGRSLAAATDEDPAAIGGKPAKAVASGRQGGNIGMLTSGRLERAAYGAQAVVCALIRFLHTDLYD
jgi:inosine/xanthosine triphosphatase